jgi:serine/threonine protein kinase
MVKVERRVAMSLAKAKELFVELVAHVPQDLWDARLAELTDGDDEMQHQVARILAAHRDAGSFLESPAPALCITGDEPVAERPGAIIGPYKLLAQVGEGGFGVVFLAEQAEPVRRKVALKVLKPGMDTRQVVARFEAERQALAIMDHPNIAKVFDGGATGSGRPYFVMEYVLGVPITQYSDEQRLSPRQRLELFVDVCQAVQHAHQKAIIHRDIKPANVMVSRYDTPVVKVIDFGVAKALGEKLTDTTLVTGVAQMIGTPLYMSPEQAGMSDMDVDTRSDIYSLGVLLYELLTGTTPFSKDRFKQVGYDEIRRIIREEDPPRPSTRLSELGDSLPAQAEIATHDPASTLATVAAQRHTEPTKLTRLVRGELDWIVMRALEKDRNRRYQTASELGNDIERYLHNEPVHACPPTIGYRLRTFSRKHRKGLMAASAFILLLLVATSISIGLAAWALRANAQTRQALEDVKSEQNATRAAFERETAARADTRRTMARVSDRVIEESLSRKVQLTDRDKKFIRDILNDYENIAAKKGDSTEARALCAEGNFRVAALREKLGEMAEAETAFRKALAIQNQLALDFPEVAEYRQELARGHNNFGLLLGATGRPELAETNIRTALEFQCKLVADDSGVPQYRQELAGSWNNLGNLQLTKGRLADAETSYAAAMQIRSKLADEFPKSPAYRWDLAGSQQSLGLLMNKLGRPRETEEAACACVETLTRLVADFPESPEYREHLATSRHNLSIVLRGMNRTKDAEAAARASLEIRAKLCAEFPAVPQYRHQLASSYYFVAVVLRDTRRPKDAETAARAALEIQKRLADELPTVPTYRQDLARSYLLLGALSSETNRPAEAEAAMYSALEIQRSLATDFGDQPSIRNDLAGSLVNLANVRVRQRAFEVARQLLDEARPHHEAALIANPNDFNARQFWRNNRWKLCDALLGLADHAELAKAADVLAAISFEPAHDAYIAASYMARCVPLAQQDQWMPAAGRDDLARTYGERAMALLQVAFARGYKDTARLAKDDRFAPLQSRDDFKKLLNPGSMR